MRRTFLLLLVAAVCSLAACTKEKHDDRIPDDMPRTQVPGELQSLWMHGYFSATEFWSQDPSEYLGNGLELAFAFKFNADGTYTQYFAASSYMAGAITYQQSVTIGTVEIDPVAKTIKTHPYKAHYRRTRNRQVLEERDLTKEETAGVTNYTYTTGTEPSGTKAIYLTLQGTTEPYTFLEVQ